MFPRNEKLERGYVRMFPWNENRNEGTFAKSFNHPFTKPPFYLPVILFGWVLGRWLRTRIAKYSKYTAVPKYGWLHSSAPRIKLYPHLLSNVYFLPSTIYYPLSTTIYDLRLHFSNHGACQILLLRKPWQTSVEKPKHSDNWRRLDLSFSGAPNLHIVELHPLPKSLHEHFAEKCLHSGCSLVTQIACNNAEKSTPSFFICNE